MAAPKHSYVSKSIWMLEAVLFGAVSTVVRCLPLDSASNFGAWLLRRLGPSTPAHRVAERNLRIVFPLAENAEINRLLGAQWAELGRTAAE